MSRKDCATPLLTPTWERALQTCTVCKTGPPAHVSQDAPPTVAERLRRFLSAYWLRPENALWMTLRSIALAAEPLRGPSADICCGDGIFSFLHAGGELDDAFDVFTAVDKLDQVTNQHADMFDHVPQHYAPPIVRPARWSIDAGTDLKPAMLAKARALHLYHALVQHNSNDPLPFDDENLATIYCNAAYWIEQIDPFLAELRRVLRPDGRLVLHIKLDSMSEYTLNGYRSQLGERFLEILGRGRLACWPTLASRSAWERRFANAGLKIASATPFATRTHAQLWDVGLRPLAPLLVRMANGLTPQNRVAIKREWVALLEELAGPMAKFDFELTDGDSEPAEIQYVLTR